MFWLGSALALLLSHNALANGDNPIQPLPEGTNLHLPEGCQQMFLRFSATLGQNPFDRPLFIISGSPPIAPDVLSVPSTIFSGIDFRSVYIETKHIKRLRDKAHLSPKQVDEIIITMKQMIIDSIKEHQIVVQRLEADYKSIRFDAVNLDPALLEQALEAAKAKFEAYLESKFPADLALKRPSVLQILKGIPEYVAPYGVGIGATIKEANIAARVGYLGNASVKKPINSFAEVQPILFEHYQRSDRLRQDAVRNVYRQYGIGQARRLLVRSTNGMVLSPALNSLLRKISNPQILAQEIQFYFDLPSAPTASLVESLINYYQEVRAFEPPLEYLETEKVEATDQVSTRSSADIVSAASFIVSADIRDVGAYHATELQAQLAGASTKTKEDFLRLVESISYGKSMDRFRGLLKQARAIIDRSTISKPNSPAKKIESKVMGDEVIKMFTGEITDWMIADLVAHSTSDMRLTIVHVDSLNRANHLATESDVNELRHIGETTAKVFSEGIARWGTRHAAEVFKFLVDVSVSPETDGKKIRLTIYHKPLSPKLTQVEREGIRRSMQEVKAQLLSRGIPSATLDRIENISFFALPD